MFSKNTPNITVISESGLYCILAKCNLPKCEPWFVAKDVCECLDLGNPSQAIARLEDDERWLISNEALRHACLPISQIQIQVPEIGIENVPVYVPVEESDPFRLLHACVPNRLRFV